MRYVIIGPLGFEEVLIEDSYGRVLAEDIYSSIDVPPFDRSTMYGYAVRSEDLYGASEITSQETVLGFIKVYKGWY